MKTKGKKKDTKQAVIDAAIRLFHMYGYSGTSVRAIAAEAGVNAALVSYYFGGKKALLEYLMETFYENYLRELETVVETCRERHTRELLDALAERLIRYQQKHFYLSLFVHREVTLDSTLVRELMTTYLMKEKYLLETIFETGAKKDEVRQIPVDLLVLQYRNMIILPFLQPLYLRQVYTLEPSLEPFINRYCAFIRHWTREISRHPATEPPAN
ncbi:forespore capture DNA-binding protein RefZ [Camelliibacillus cellulosilyticus]|uniref:Forespore capture DNA-binding protein RefZ n=1 Tax=Camelliibacillus cellulosilyticus TaxID=2174486 RepID=A0ABV9GK17_9BACL